MPKERAGVGGTDTPELTGTYTYDYDLPRAHAYVVESLAGDTVRQQAYVAGAEEYLVWYEKMRLPSAPKFGQADTRDDHYAPYRAELIREYLDHAKAYVRVNVLYAPPRTSLCPCGAPLTSTTLSKEGLHYCIQCGVYRPGLSKKSASSASEDLAPRKIPRKETEERDNFVKALARFQGMQKDRFPSDLFERLDHYFVMNNYPRGEDVRTGNTHGTVLTKDLMNKAMAAVGYPLYEHTNLICHKLWGWSLPQLGPLYELVLTHFDATQRVAHDQGIPSVNTQYRLFKHLEMSGFPCYAVDFRIPKTREIIQNEEEHWRAMCEGVSEAEKALGIQFIPTL